MSREVRDKNPTKMFRFNTGFAGVWAVSNQSTLNA